MENPKQNQNTLRLRFPFSVGSTALTSYARRSQVICGTAERTHPLKKPTIEFSTTRRNSAKLYFVVSRMRGKRIQRIVA